MGKKKKSDFIWCIQQKSLTFVDAQRWSDARQYQWGFHVNNLFTL